MRPALILWLLLIEIGIGSAADTPPSADQARFFEINIRPLLAENCYQCHGPDKQKGDLRLDSAERILRGGVSGPAVVPGFPEKSLLIKAISYADESLKMPPKKKLSDRQIELLSQWVKSGAVYPASVASGKPQAEFWAFKPPVDPPIPAVRNTAWPKNGLDRFVLAKLEAAGLQPAAPADKRTLIRRASFDLTGLPPTPTEIDAFLADQSPEAFARVVERLLASPAYGERWGRHWLDVARYADSNGLDENVAHGNAWRYRDYVLAAFNKDKPFDQFVLEQLAGDLLPAADSGTRHERLIATGFLSLGPKVLAEVDEKKMEMDIVDEQIDTVGRCFLALTLGCARCHDHKFDPIPTEDYYALAGIFKSTRTMEHFTKIARWWENPVGTEQDLARKMAYDKQVSERKAAMQALSAKIKEPAKDASLKKLKDELAALEKAAPDVPTAMGVSEGRVSDVAIHIRGSHLKLGSVTPRHFPRVLAGETQPPLPAKQSGRLELARWLGQRDHPLTSRVMINRIWRWHFGRGIVPSTDNFGKLGDSPVDQALVDWLAHRFVDCGWSIKAMHRLIMLSRTYQMSSTFNARAAAADPENRLLWRFDVRRLEAEAIRDALLFVSGTLDQRPGGSFLPVKNREFLFDHTSKDNTKYDMRKRSVYLPVIRNHLYDVFQLFDFTDATVLSGDRATTTVAPQALFMMNSELVDQASDSLAGRVLDESATDSQRVQRLYERAYGRKATAAEVDRALQFLRKAEAALPESSKRGKEAWTLLCQVVLDANEFIYVR